MDPSARDRSTIERHLATARERLRALGALMDAGGAQVDALRAAFASALGALDEAHSLVADPREAARVPCPYCGYRVMSEALLCASCWRKLAASGAS